MSLTTLIIVNAVLAAIVIWGIVVLHAHGVRHDRRHAERHLGAKTMDAAVPERERIAA
jgi:4-hydroxy-3-methylbut-2-enyl diphosphate reductase IspH